MDKTPTAGEVAALSLMLAAAGHWLSRTHPLLGLIPFLWNAVWLGSVVVALSDSPEPSPAYVVNVCVIGLAVVALQIAGVWQWYRDDGRR
jgi:hypothetical protein